MKQPKKIFTRMLMNNWGGISHQVILFHEYVNLFSGKSGSGKSTVMDAMQVVLYGSIRNDFLNRAADDTKNKRSALSYLRGAQKDGTANRENQDFCSQIVLEMKDTGSQAVACIGVAFEVAKGDQEVNKYCFFSHAGEFPEDLYLAGGKTPYTYSQLQRLIQERAGESNSGFPLNINRIYPTQDAYLNTVNDVIFGYVDAGRFKTMEKSAIALRMANGTGQFIKDYMFPRSKEDTIAAISDQLAAYREIKEQVENLEHEISLLEKIHLHDAARKEARQGSAKAEEALRIWDIEDRKAHLAAREEELGNAERKLAFLEEQDREQKISLKEKRDVLDVLRAELLGSDFGKKKEQLIQLQETIRLCGREADDWNALSDRLKQWDETEGVSDYVSNPTRNLLEQVFSGTVTEEEVLKLKRGLKEAFDSVTDEINDLRDELRIVTGECQEKKEILDDLKRDKKHYRRELKEARRKLSEELSARYKKTVHVEILADLFDVTDEEWRNAVEASLGRIKFGLTVEPKYARMAAEIFRKMKKKEYESIDLIQTEAMIKDRPGAEPNSLYEAVTTEIPYVDACLKRYLGYIRKCGTAEELQEAGRGVTQDCYSYGNYMFRHLREQDYRYPSIGRKVSLKQMRELEEDIYRLNGRMIALQQEISELSRVNDLERLQSYEYGKLHQLADSALQLKKYNRRAEKLEQELKELEQGTLVTAQKDQIQQLEAETEQLEAKKEMLQKESVHWATVKGELEKEVLDKREALKRLQEGFLPDQSLQKQVIQALEEGRAASFKKKQANLLEQFKQTEERETELRGSARMQFIKAFPSSDFCGIEKENTLYDALLARCRTNFEPKYKAEFDSQYKLIYKMLRENVIAAIHGEIKAAKRHRREINAMLAKIRFSDSIYQIDILPAEDENRQFYEMLMAEELDLKIPDMQSDGQLSLGEDLFYQKYEQQIRRLTDKFMPPRDADPAARAGYRKDMARYADYRTYLKFCMYEQTQDAKGNVRKNYVDDMAGRDSGGEGQNPKYVALFAGFAMLYMQQSSRDSKIRLVLLDEAFSKMDKERSEVCLHYARQLELQLVVCVPDERLQSLVQNVDCVYAFRREKNQISMIHIDKGEYIEMLEGIRPVG